MTRRNYAAEGAARIEAMRVAEADATREAEAAVERLQVLSGITLNESDVKAYVFGYRDGFIRGLAGVRTYEH